MGHIAEIQTFGSEGRFRSPVLQHWPQCTARGHVEFPILPYCCGYIIHIINYDGWLGSGYVRTTLAADRTHVKPQNLARSLAAPRPVRHAGYQRDYVR